MSADIPSPGISYGLDFNNPAKVISVSDDIRAKIVGEFEKHSEHLAGFREYSIKVGALAIEYHNARLNEVFPALVIEEMTPVIVLDARETPTSLDSKLISLKDAPIAQIIFDRATGKYTLYTKLK